MYKLPIMAGDLQPIKIGLHGAFKKLVVIFLAFVLLFTSSETMTPPHSGGNSGGGSNKPDPKQCKISILFLKVYKMNVNNG